MAFELLKEGELARLHRREAADFFPSPNVLVWLNEEKNIMHINAELYDQLIEMDQHRTLRTQKTLLLADRDRHGNLTVEF